MSEIEKCLDKYLDERQRHERDIERGERKQELANDDHIGNRHPMMKCGHAANSTCDGKPSCAICHGIHPGWCIIDESPPSLAGRTAKCAYGMHALKPSSTNLAFFEHRPNESHDIYYCGCHGWD